MFNLDYSANTVSKVAYKFTLDSHQTNQLNFKLTILPIYSEIDILRDNTIVNRMSNTNAKFIYQYKFRCQTTFSAS